MKVVDEKQGIKHKGSYIWQPVLISGASSLPSLLHGTHTATHSLACSMSLACSLTTMEVAATKHYTAYSYVLVLQELHVSPGNLSCTPVWEPLMYSLKFVYFCSFDACGKSNWHFFSLGLMVGQEASCTSLFQLVYVHVSNVYNFIKTL